MESVDQASAAADSSGRASSGVLNAGERSIDSEHVGNVLGTLSFHAVPPKAASESRLEVSRAADSRKLGNGRHT